MSEDTSSGDNSQHYDNNDKRTIEVFNYIVNKTGYNKTVIGKSRGNIVELLFDNDNVVVNNADVGAHIS